MLFEEQWRKDKLTEAYCNDVLWGYMIQISEQLCLRVPGEYEDDILFKLICKGVFDWDRDDHRTNASTQVMRHSTVMVHQVLERIKQVETMVSRLLIVGATLHPVLPGRIGYNTCHRINLTRLSLPNFRVHGVRTGNRSLEL